MNKVTDDKAGVSQEISNARLKYWLDFWKVIFGTAVVGFVTAIFGFVIDWRGKDLEDFKARSNFYNNHAQTIIESEISDRIVLADYFKRFSPVKDDRSEWENYWKELNEKLSENPKLIEINKSEILSKTYQLNKLESQIALAQEVEKKVELNKEISQLESTLTKLTLDNEILKTELSGVREKRYEEQTEASSERIYPAGQIGQQRGIRNNNPVFVDRSPWDGRLPQNEMTPIQQAETRFAVFIHPKWSYRAGAKVLLNNVYEKKSSVSVFDHLFKWLSGDEKARRRLSRDIEQELGINKDTPVNILDPKVAETILKKLTILLNGSNPYPEEFISEGVALLPEFSSLNQANKPIHPTADASAD